MSLKKLKKEKLELMSNKDIALLVLQDNKKPMITADIFKKIIELLELPESTFENKIGEFYTQLATDKNFILLDDGTWDLRVNHKSSKVLDTDDESEAELYRMDNSDSKYVYDGPRLNKRNARRFMNKQTVENDYFKEGNMDHDYYIAKCRHIYYLVRERYTDYWWDWKR